MSSRESSALLKFWTLTFNLTVLPAGLRILLNLLFLTSNLTVLPACLRILLNLLLSFPSVSFTSTFAGFRWCCWLGCCCCSGHPFSLLGGGWHLPFRQLLQAFCWIHLSPRLTCLARRVVSSRLPIF